MTGAVSIRDLASKCLMEEFLGKGAFGDVHQVIHRKSGERYALKKIYLKNKNYKTLAENEITIQNRFSHPNLARLVAYEVDRQDKKAWLLLELLEGGTLQSKLDWMTDNRKLMPVQQVEMFLMQMANGLNYMHHAEGRPSNKSFPGSYVHRDLKPENMLFADNKEQVLKLADFGLTVYLAPNEMLKDAAGTFSYQAPEVHLLQPHDAKSDIYSAGCVAFYMLTGKQPLEGLSRAEFVQRYSSGVPIDMSAAYARDAGLANLIESMLRFDPELRISAARVVKSLKCRKEAVRAQNARASLAQMQQQQLREQTANYEKKLTEQTEHIRQLQEREFQWQRYSQADPFYLAWYQACWQQHQLLIIAQQQYYTTALHENRSFQLAEESSWSIVGQQGGNSKMSTSMTASTTGSSDIVEMHLSAGHVDATDSAVAQRR